MIPYCFSLLIESGLICESNIEKTDDGFFCLNKSISDILSERKSRQLPYLMEQGALVVQAHPFREAGYIDHIRLFPRAVEGIEVMNADRTDFENKMANLYADEYGLLKTAGSDNHWGKDAKRLAGLESEEAIVSVEDFIKKVREGKMNIFVTER